jgi:NADPH:quinone reductase-like Zn-dependent oxidoreductase
MKALILRRFGGPDVFEPADMPAPEPGPGEVLVRVRACALNHLDVWVRKGLNDPATFMPHICGSDVAGEVAEVGVGVTSLKAGQRVVVQPGICPDPDHGGDESSHPGYDILGMRRQGGYAEFVCAPARNVLPVSDRYDFVHWAATPLVFTTAWHMLFDRAQLKPGETVLVQAGGSGVGIAAIQMAKVAGARVLTTVGSPEKFDKARALGADEVIDYVTTDLVTEVRRLTDRRGVDVVIEHVGGDTFLKSLKCLSPKGRLVTCGATAGPKVEIDIRALFTRQTTVLGSFMGNLRDYKQALALLETGKLKPVVDSTFPLEKAGEAHRRLEDRRAFGKVVLEVE